MSSVLDKKMTKRSEGRKKIEIKKIEKKSNKLVTFSKRRTGLFNKASELCILCGAEVAVIVFSPNDKLFCFGHPSVDAVIRRYLNGDSSPTWTDSVVTEDDSSRAVAAYMEAVEELKALKKRVAEAKNKINNKITISGTNEFWWDQEVDGMGMEELEGHVVALHELRRKVADRVEELTMANGGRTIPQLDAVPHP